MRSHPAHPLLAPLRAIYHLRQVFVQNASLRIQSYGDQWLRTIPPAASRLLQSAAGKQLRQETWDKHVAFFFKALSGKEDAPTSSAPVVMLPQVPVSGLQPLASAKPMPWVPLASQASYGITLPPQSLSALSALDERDSFLVEKQVCSQLPFSLSACVLVRPSRLVNCRSGSSQISRMSQKHLRRSPRSQRCLQTSAGGMAARRKLGPAAWPSQDSGMALLLRSGTGWLPWEAPWLLLSGLQKWNVSAFPPPGQSAHCSSYAAGTAVIPSCLASVSSATEQAFDCLLSCIDNSYRQLPAQVTFIC